MCLWKVDLYANSVPHFLGVLSRMCNEPTESSKALAALRAKVRLGVSQAVSVHQTLQSKCFATCRTYEVLGGLLPSDFHSSAFMLSVFLDAIFLNDTGGWFRICYCDFRFREDFRAIFLM